MFKEDTRPVSASSGYVLSNRRGEWIGAGIAFLAMVWFVLEYHRLWRFKGYAVGTVNEGLAIAGTCGIAMALLLGRFGGVGALRMRRPIGVVAVIGLAMHGLLSLLWFQKYVWAWPHSVSLALGLLSMVCLGAVGVSSYRWAADRLGPRRWKSLQAWSYVFLVVGLTHFVVLGKIPSWVNWFRTFDKPAPPGTIIPFALGVIALGAKGFSMWRRKGTTHA